MQYSEAERALMALDPVMDRLIHANGPIVHMPHSSYFEALCESIISQQLSVKASDTIFRRFKELTELDPEKALHIDEAARKAIGLSPQKARYIHDLAEHFVRDRRVFSHLESLGDDEVIIELTQIKGVGVWTAQMFLMFTLTRPDIFAPDDLGLLNAMTKAYGLPAKPTKQEALALAERWIPHRTTACFHLWRSLDNAPS